MSIDLNKIKKIYVIGIKGSGIIAVVEILKAMGKEITGSDTDEKFFTDEILARLGIEYFEKFAPENVSEDADLILYSTSYNEENNVEIRTAKEKKLPMASYPEMLAELFNEKWGIAVAGTHGKTTTSAMLAHVLKTCETDPTAVIGSKVANWNSNALVGAGEYFVLEADEYQNKLALYGPKAAILTSCDFDHPDYFQNFEIYKKTFKDFVARLPHVGFLVVWGDSVDTLEVSKSCKADVLTYGVGEENDYQIINYQLSIINEFSNSNSQNSKQTFEIKFKGSSLGEFEIQLPGKHNVLNAAAVVATCHKLQLDMDKVRESLLDFRGTARRFELIGERNGAILIDDYGHHPEEIMATLSGARERYPEKNIWAVFHPHTFTRTQALLAEFSQSFSDADKVLVLDIYGSARETQGGVHSKDLVSLINKFDRDKAEYVPTIPEAVEYLKDKIGPDDVVITIGAGNVWEVAEKLKEK